MAVQSGHALRAEHRAERRSGIAAPISPKRWRIAASATRRAISPSRSTTARNSPAPLTAGWHAYNITSDTGTGIGAWSDDEVCGLSRHGPRRRTAARRPGPMGEAVDHSFSQMAPSGYPRARRLTCAACRRLLRPTCRRRSRRRRRRRPKRAARPPTRAASKVFEAGLRQLPQLDWRQRRSRPSRRSDRQRARSTIPAATNVAQIVISGTRRLHAGRRHSMPAFGRAYSDNEIAAVANYVTARFGSAPSKVTAKDVADLRGQTAY